MRLGVRDQYDDKSDDGNECENRIKINGQRKENGCTAGKCVIYFIFSGKDLGLELRATQNECKSSISFI